MALRDNRGIARAKAHSKTEIRAWGRQGGPGNWTAKPARSCGNRWPAGRARQSAPLCWVCPSAPSGEPWRESKRVSAHCSGECSKYLFSGVGSGWERRPVFPSKTKHNQWRPKGVHGFQDRRFQPLTHPSGLTFQTLTVTTCPLGAIAVRTSCQTIIAALCTGWLIASSG